MIRRTLHALAALTALALLLAGWPAALLAAGRAAAPWLPDLGDPLGLIARPDAGGLFLLLVLALGWAAWALWTAAVLVEAAAQVRGVPTPRLGGLFPQHSAAALVTAIAIAFTASPGAALAGGPVSAPPPAAAAAVLHTDAVAPSTPIGAADAGPGQQQAEDGVRDYTVAAGDTMWDIAGDQLADPHRWPEIAQASHGIPQPGGRTLADPDLILPGWTLHIPDPEDQTDPAPTAPPTADPAPTGTAPATAEPAPAPEGGGEPTAGPALPGTPLQTPTPRAAEDAPAAGPASPDDSGAGEAPGAGATVSLPDTPFRPADPATAAETGSLPATPLAASRAGTLPAGWAIDDEGRAGPSHGVLGLPDWITDPLTPTHPAGAPDLVDAVTVGPASR